MCFSANFLGVYLYLLSKYAFPQIHFEFETSTVIPDGLSAFSIVNPLLNKTRTKYLKSARFHDSKLKFAKTLLSRSFHEAEASSRFFFVLRLFWEGVLESKLFVPSYELRNVNLLSPHSVISLAM